MTEQIRYIAFDGDNVGSRLSILIEGGDEEEISRYAFGVAQEMEEVAKAAAAFGAKVLLCSGDSLLFRTDASRVSEILEAFEGRRVKVATYSVGVGRNVQEAQLKLMHAKVAGKNRVCWFHEPVPFGQLVWQTIKNPLAALKNFWFKGGNVWVLTAIPEH